MCFGFVVEPKPSRTVTVLGLVIYLLLTCRLFVKLQVFSEWRSVTAAFLRQKLWLAKVVNQAYKRVAFRCWAQSCFKRRLDAALKRSEELEHRVMHAEALLDDERQATANALAVQQSEHVLSLAHERDQRARMLQECLGHSRRLTCMQHSIG